MALVKASEWLPSFFGEGNGLLDRFFKDDFFDWSKFNFASKTLPAVNVKETDEKFTLEMAAPGLSKDKFKIEVKDNMLCISSEQKDEKKDEKENYTRREFRYESFMRSFSLPENTDADKIKAEYKDGLLILDIPKKQKESKKNSKTIQVS